MINIVKITITAGLILFGLFAYNLWQNQQTLKQTEFRDYRKEFRAEIDSLKLSIDSVKTGLLKVQANQDTIKDGQHIIYKQIKEKSNTVFFDNLIKFME